MPILSHLHQLFSAAPVNPTSIRYGGKIARCNAPVPQPSHWSLG